MKNILLTIIISISTAQVNPVNALHNNTPRVFVLENGKIITKPGKIIDSGKIVIRNGIIEAVGKKVSVPADAYKIDISGKTVYPGFIESYWKRGNNKPSTMDLGKEKKKDKSHPVTNHWNERVQPEYRLIDDFQPKEKELETLRSLGFTAAQVVPDKGIFRGRSSLIHLGNWGPESVIAENGPAQIMAFEQGSWRDKGYPNSLMGTIALIRQTFYDAQWNDNAWTFYNRNQDKTESPDLDRALETLSAVMKSKLPFCFETGQELAALRVQKIAEEFDLNFWLKGSGYEYRRLNEIKEMNTFVIVPLNYPKTPDVGSWEDALDFDLEQLRHWDQAPDNTARMVNAGIDIALTSSDLKDRKQFHINLLRSIERGLSKDDALAALTTIPAAKLGLSNLGKVDKGYVANLVITDGDYFQKNSKVTEVWIQGKQYVIKDEPVHDVSGKWDMTLSGGLNLDVTLELTQKNNKFSGKLVVDSTEIKLKDVENETHRLAFTFPGKDLNLEGVVRLSGTLQNKFITGSGVAPDGSEIKWTAHWTNTIESKDANEKEESKKESPSELIPLFPEGAYGFAKPPSQTKKILVKNATIWTCGSEGILENADMFIRNGILEKIGKNIKVSGNDVYIIDASEKHITPGLIDAHNHSSAFAINEGTQSVTAEVRIYDVLNSDDIAIYRQLAGGLTIVNILHGSANAIGGQNAVIKLRWGQTPEEILFKEAPQGIKFALGENVKQSNWGDDYTTRYPQTRMGVEQIIRDAFAAATDYAEALGLDGFEKKSNQGNLPVRKDLELDALVEIMQGKRLVHCHSYRQDEILMLTRIAEDYGFTIGVFQHVLEGYKVAERIAEHGAGASTFTDWWGYKFEVIDAIPYNGTIMNEVGVVTSFNSDSNELARRMNNEAAKAVKYGGVSQEEALKFVTINPAKQLGIDQYVGSLEKGKNGDFVIWSDNPLSSYTHCEQTWIEGTQYFSKERDAEMRNRIADERNMLIQKILTSDDKDGGKPMKPNGDSNSYFYSCSEGGDQ
jgi:imidazolonepropionase-like amidohydrolase